MSKIIILLSLLAIILSSNAIDSFSFSLYDEISNQTNSNLIISPFSAKIALSMCSEGAIGSTQTQILSSCNLPTIQKKRLSQMLSIMQNCQQSQEQNYTLTIANSLWTKQSNPPLQSYIDTVKQNYLAQVSALNFNDPVLAAQTVNQWISNKTKGLIQNVLKPNDIQPNTYMILVNALYFEGAWLYPFQPFNTQNKTFYANDNSFSQVQMMAQYSQEFLYYSNDQIQMVELPYVGYNVVMDIILPIEQSNLNSVESELTQNFYTYVQNMQSTNLNFFVPKFKFNTQQNLNKYIKNLGIANAFNSTLADFAGIDGKKDLYISSVIQQAFIEMSETGTKAAAATVIDLAGGSAFPPQNPIIMNCNHPFIFILRNVNSQEIYFIGRVTNPN